MSDQTDTSNTALPLRWILASAIGWALIFSAVGHTATPLLKAGADSALQGLGDWTSARLKDEMGAPSNLSTIVNGLFLWILQIPLVLIFAVFTMLLGFVAVVFTLLDRAYGFAVLGFLAGFLPGRHVHPFGQAADRLGWLGALFGISAVQAFTVRGTQRRIWAAAPVVIGAVAVSLVWMKIVPMMREQGLIWASSPVQSIVRYEPTPTWQRVITNGEWRFELRQVVLTPRQVETTIRCFHLSNGSARFRVDPQTLLESYQPGKLGISNQRQVLSKEYLPLRASDAPGRAVSVTGQDYRDLTLYFGRPATPHQRWGLSLYAGTMAKGGVRVPFIFDLSP